jgi:hypothetical protein
MIFYIIIFNFTTSTNLSLLFDTDIDSPKVMVLGIEGRIGEGILHDEVVQTMNELGWRVISVTTPESLTTYSLTQHFFTNAASLISFFFNPVFILSTTHYTYMVPYGFNLAYINVPKTMLINYNQKFRAQFAFLNEVDGYIDINSFAKGDSNWLKAALGKEDFEKKLVIPAYLSRRKTEYSNIPKDKALITGSLWGCNRSSPMFKLALKQLAQEGYVEAVGLQEFYQDLGNAYKGLKSRDELSDFQGCYGIGLIIHNFDHLIYGIPTNRLAEVVTSSGIVISDKHPMIEKYFKDNVLYFDSMQNEDVIYEQIKAHIDWVRANPDAANKKVRNALEIFNNNFVLERILNNILQQVKGYKKLNKVVY